MSSVACESEVAQSCPTLCDPMDCSLPGSSLHGILQARVLEWVAIFVHLFLAPWTVAHQAPPSMGFSRPEYWSGLPFPPAGDRPDPGIKPESPRQVLYYCAAQEARRTCIRKLKMLDSNHP